MAAKNLGQVAGLFIGTIAPTNHALIWYDSVTHVHKTYDTSINSWTVLDPRYITAITYNGLVSRAAGDGLTQGQWYKIIDKGNVLAIAITATKVQYANNNGVLVIDDLGTHIVYTVTSENLIIDDITGVYDANTNKLVFSFAETTPDFNTGDTNVDYVLGEQKRGTSKTLKKFRISSFLSTVTGNDITWNGGFFFNFYNKLITYFDVNGGIVSHETFEQFKTLNNQAIANIANTVASATTDAQIYSKHLPETPTPAAAADIIVNDTLQTIVFKIQRWIWQLKAGDGIQVTSTGMVEPEEGNIWPTDTIFTAIKKLLYKIAHIGTDSILDGAVTTAKLANGAVTTNKIADESITSVKIIEKGVTTLCLDDNAVTVDKLANNAVTSDKIYHSAVTTDKIADNAVATSHIQGLAVTTSKIANGAVTIDKLENMLLPQTYYGGFPVTSSGVTVEISDLCEIVNYGGFKFWGTKSINMDHSTSIIIDSYGPSDAGYPDYPLVLWLTVSLGKSCLVKFAMFSILSTGSDETANGLIKLTKDVGTNRYIAEAWKVRVGFI